MPKDDDVFKKYKLVKLEWLDAESSMTWETESEVAKWLGQDCTIHELGWIVSENKTYLIISNQITYDGDIGNRTKIKKSWIRKKEYVSLKLEK